MARLTDLTAFSGVAIDDLDEFWIDDYNSLTATMTSADPCVVTITAHGLVANNIVVFTTTGALPNNVVAGTDYYVLSTGLTVDDFQISATAGGTPIDSTSGTQSGVHTATYYVSRKMAGSQIKTLLGNVGYSETFTPGTVAVANTITHNLSSTEIAIELWDVTTGEQIFADLDNRTTNTVDVTFGVNPAGDVNIVILANGGTIATDSRPYKVLTGLISQTATSAPTMIVLENTLGTLPVWSYQSVGTYRFTSAGLFTSGKTIAFVSNGSGSLGSVLNTTYTTNYVSLNSTISLGFADGLFGSATFEVRIYD